MGRSWTVAAQVMVIAMGYAVVRYVLLGGVSADRLPVFITNKAVAVTLPSHELVCPNGFQTDPNRSCRIKRPTRVPASSVVRIKSASNMIAK